MRQLGNAVPVDLASIFIDSVIKSADIESGE